jgi:Fe-S-cluster containining protein
MGLATTSLSGKSGLAGFSKNNCHKIKPLPCQAYPAYLIAV